MHPLDVEVVDIGVVGLTHPVGEGAVVVVLELAEIEARISRIGTEIGIDVSLHLAVGVIHLRGEGMDVTDVQDLVHVHEAVITHLHAGEIHVTRSNCQYND